jgi:hypothetical protein
MDFVKAAYPLAAPNFGTQPYRAESSSHGAHTGGRVLIGLCTLCSVGSAGFDEGEPVSIKEFALYANDLKNRCGNSPADRDFCGRCWMTSVLLPSVLQVLPSPEGGSDSERR